MKKLVLLSFCLLITSCATRFILPNQRFLSPEVQGGALKTSIELHKTSAHEAKLRGTDQGIVGVSYQEISRSAYQFSTGLFDQLDLVWTHVGSGNSLIGAKFQLVGSGRGSGAGSKFSLAYLVGGNEHESEDKSLTMKLNAQEVWAIWGLRFNEFIMPYASFGYGSYQYKGQIKRGAFAGEAPRIGSDLYTLMLGMEAQFQGFIFKLESGGQLIESSKTKDKWAYMTGFSLGFAW